MTNLYEEKKAARIDRMRELARKMAAASEASLSRARDMASIIPFGQPILIGHHSECRDRRYRARIHNTYGRAFKLQEAARELEARADYAESNRAICSDDPEAAAKLRARIADLEKSQQTMVAANKLIRKGDLVGLAALVGEGIAKEMTKPGRFGGWGARGFELSNNSANIRRLKLRLKQVEARAKLAESCPVKEIAAISTGARLVDNREQNRLQVFFPGKPPAEVRDVLKRAGFRWAPSVGAWQAYRKQDSLEAAKNLLSGGGI